MPRGCDVEEHNQHAAVEALTKSDFLSSLGLHLDINVVAGRSYGVKSCVVESCIPDDGFRDDVMPFRRCTPK